MIGKIALGTQQSIFKEVVSEVVRHEVSKIGAGLYADVKEGYKERREGAGRV